MLTTLATVFTAALYTLGILVAVVCAIGLTVFAIGMFVGAINFFRS